MKKLFLILTILFVGCALWATKYKYYYNLNDPPSSDMIFTDDMIKVEFFISNKEINFELKNKTDEFIKIIWDEASIVQFGKAKRVMHSGIKYTDRNTAQAPTTIPPGAKISDLVIPTENVYWVSGGDWVKTGWRKRDLFPTSDRGQKIYKKKILNSKGQQLFLYLPIMIKGNIKNYKFEFIIADVQKIEQPGY